MRNFHHSANSQFFRLRREICSWNVISVQFAAYDTKSFRQRGENLVGIEFSLSAFFPYLLSRNFHIKISEFVGTWYVEDFLLVLRLNWQLPNDHDGKHFWKISSWWLYWEANENVCTLAMNLRKIVKWGVNFILSLAILVL